jgi:hypothetical protein
MASGAPPARIGCRAVGAAIPRLLERGDVMRTTLIRRGGLSVAVACVLLVGIAAIAQAAVTINESMPVDIFTTNICNGEDVEFTGTGHVLMTYSPAANGGTSVTAHENFSDVTGIGSFGNTYVIPSAIDVSTVTNGATTVTGAGYLALISTGSAPNVLAHLTEHITLNANGVPTASITNITAEGCRG